MLQRTLSFWAARVLIAHLSNLIRFWKTRAVLFFAMDLVPISFIATQVPTLSPSIGLIPCSNKTIKWLYMQEAHRIKQIGSCSGGACVSKIAPIALGC